MFVNQSISRSISWWHENGDAGDCMLSDRMIDRTGQDIDRIGQ